MCSTIILDDIIKFFFRFGLVWHEPTSAEEHTDGAIQSTDDDWRSA